jgi:hypothetical protein
MQLRFPNAEDNRAKNRIDRADMGRSGAAPVHELACRFVAK